jgi:hypothetical protein
VNWDNGTLSLGAVTIDAGASLLFNGVSQLPGAGGTVNANLTNGGTFCPGTSPGILTIAGGNNYQQAASGTLVMELGGKSTGTQYSQLAVTGAASLAGGLQLRLINGFIPQPGDTFELLTCTARTGTFSGLSGPEPADAGWLLRYTGTNVMLTLASRVPLATPSLAEGILRLPFNTTSGLTYVVQKADTLSPPDWQTLATVQGSGALEAAEDSTGQPEAFYRVLMQ